MRGKKRPTSERARAVGIALVDGASAASEATGLPRQTIQGWMETPEFGELRQRTKDQVVGEWFAGVQLAFRRSITLLDKTDDPVKAATAGAIMFDKLALTRGDATTRSEVTHFRDYNDEERRRLRDALDRVLEELPEGSAPAGAEDSRAEVR